MIRFSAGLVVVAIGVLIGGVATSKLLLVYIAIGLSVAALIALAIGVVLKREELFGEQRVAAPAAAGTGIQPNETVDPLAARVPAVASAATGEAGARGAAGFARDRAAQSPFDEPAYGQGASGYGGDVFGPPAKEKGQPEHPARTRRRRALAGRSVRTAPGRSSLRPRQLRPRQLRRLARPDGTAPAVAGEAVATAR